MMIAIVGLVIVDVALCSLIGWLDFNNRKERSKLINALVAKTPEQLRDLEFVDRVQPEKIVKPDLQPVEQLSDEDFTEMMGQIHG